MLQPLQLCKGEWSFPLNVSREVCLQVLVAEFSLRAVYCRCHNCVKTWDWVVGLLLRELQVMRFIKVFLTVCIHVSELVAAVCIFTTLCFDLFHSQYHFARDGTGIYCRDGIEGCCALACLPSVSSHTVCSEQATAVVH